MYKYQKYFGRAVFMILFLLITSVIADDHMVYEYSFPKPQVERKGKYARIKMDGIREIGNPGEPVLPVKGIMLLLPPGEEIESVEVIPGERMVLDEHYRILPGSELVPIHLNHIVNHIDISPKENPDIYQSARPFPGKHVKSLSPQWLYGHQVLTAIITGR